MATIAKVNKNNFLPRTISANVPAGKVNEIIQRLNSITEEDGVVKNTSIISDPFQSKAFANPLTLDAAIYKDFKCGIITGDTTINLNNSADGDSGMIEVIIDDTGGYTITLGTMFTKNLGGGIIDNTADADNFISWRKLGTDIVYVINQVV